MENADSYMERYGHKNTRSDVTVDNFHRQAQNNDLAISQTQLQDGSKT